MPGIVLMLLFALSANFSFAQDESINDQLDELKTQLNSAISDLRDQFEEAESDEEQQQVIEDRRQLELVLVTKAVALTADNDDDDHDVQMLMWLMGKTKGEGRDLAFQTLISDHIESDKLYLLADQLGRSRSPEVEIEHYLRQMIEHSSADRVKGVATLSLAGLIDRITAMSDREKDAMQERLGDEWREYADSWSGERGSEEVVKLLNACVEQYADARVRGRGTVGEKAGTQLAQMNLRVGGVAPDILGEDLDGVSFSLSEYRGKVVMLDFWGDW